MRFEVITVILVNDDSGDEPSERVGLHLEPAERGAVIPDEFEVGAEVEAAVFAEQPDLARYFAAVSEAKRAAIAHDEMRSGDGAHHEERALDLLLGNIDP